MAAVLAAVAGCDGCPGRKPYTPFSLGSTPDPTTSAAAPGSASAAAADAGPPFQLERAAKAPGDGHAWPRPEGGEIAAPPGRAFELGLWLDVDGDGEKDLLAWAIAADRSRGELWVAPAHGEARSVVALPADLSLRGCPPVASLARVGPRLLALEIALGCPDPPRDKAGRWLGVVRAGAGAPIELALELRTPPAPPGDTLTLAVDGSDRDNDGRDDATIAVSLSDGAKGQQRAPDVAAQLRFFDRPSGMSRDPSEPEASLRSRAAALAAEGRRKASAPGVARAARRLRILRSSLCEDDGGRSTTSSVGAIRCGDTGSLEESAYAEGLAAITLGDAARALAASLRLEALAPAPGPRRKEIDKGLAKLAPDAPCRAVHTALAVPAGSGGVAVGLGPLAFEASGSLLVRTDGPVFRVDRASFAEEPAVDPWPRTLGARDGTGSLSAIEQRCDPPALVAVVQRGAQRVDVILPIAAPVDADGFGRAARCAPASAVRAVPLGVDATTVVLAIGAETVALSTGEAPSATAVAGPLGIDTIARGAARSPDGSTVALHSPRGVLVATQGGSAKLWTGADLARAGGCVPASGAARIACVVEGRAVVFDPAP